MKKRIVMALAAVALMGGMTLSSCKKSNQDLINEYRSLSNEAVEAIQKGDMSKAQEIAEKADKLSKELEEANLTPEEQEELQKIAVENVQKVSTGMSGALDAVQDMMGDDSNE